MSKTNRKDPYKILRLVSIVLLLALVVMSVIYIQINNSQRSEFEKLQKSVEEQNAKLTEEYNEKLAEQQLALEERERIVSVTPAPNETGWDIVDMSDFPVKGEQTIPVTRQEALTGGLLLVNRWHALPSDFSSVEGYIQSIGTVTNFKVPVTARSVSLFPNAIDALQKFIEAAKAEGLEYYIVREGYRTQAYQQEIWDKAAAKNTDKTGDILVEYLRRSISYPGTSDYQSGFSFAMNIYSRQDPVINSTEFQKSEQARFLNENGWKYGLVFRFPAANYPYDTTVNKDNVTGVENSNLKINAYRYVGIPHATVMNIKGFVLEEYIDFLIRHPHIMVYEDGVLKYEIFRQSEVLEGEQSIKIPLNASAYSVSSDNMGGLIVAVSY